MAKTPNKSGGLLVGKTDRDGGQGIKVIAPEGEIVMGGGEVIINEEAAKTHCEELSEINQSTGGVAIPCEAQETANKGPGNMEEGGKLQGKKITIPFTKLISYDWKLKETTEELQRGELSHSKNVPVTVSYVPDLKKYLLMDGNHRALELKKDGNKSIEGIINPHVPKTFNLPADWKTSTIAEYKINFEKGGKLNNQITNEENEYMEDTKHDLKANAVSHEHKNILGATTLSWVTTNDGRHFYKVFEGEKTHEDVYNFYKEKGITITHTVIDVVTHTAKTRDLSALKKFVEKLVSEQFSSEVDQQSLMIPYTDHGDNGFTVNDFEFDLKDGSKVKYNAQDQTITKLLKSGGKLNNSFKVGDVVYNKAVNSVGIVRDVFDDGGGDLRTNMDGVVYISDLEMYDPNNEKHKTADIAPSTIKELTPKGFKFEKGGTIPKSVYDGKIFTVHMPKLGHFPAQDINMKYDQKNFMFDILGPNNKSIAKVSAVELQSNIENGLYVLQNKMAEGGKVERTFEAGYRAVGTMNTKDGEITGYVRYNPMYDTNQVTIDGSLYGEYKKLEDAIDELERSGFKNVTRVEPTGKMAEGGKLRGVKVTYDNGESVSTSMAAHLTDNDIKNYFKVGKSFNIGSGGQDKMAKVASVEILDDNMAEGGIVPSKTTPVELYFYHPTSEKLMYITYSQSANKYNFTDNSENAYSFKSDEQVQKATKQIQAKLKFPELAVSMQACKYEKVETKAEGGTMDVNAYAAIAVKDGYWIVLSTPTTKEKAQAIADSEGSVSRGEKAEVKTVKEILLHNKTLGREMLGSKMAEGGKVDSEFKKSLKPHNYDAPGYNPFKIPIYEGKNDTVYVFRSDIEPVWLERNKLRASLNKTVEEKRKELEKLKNRKPSKSSASARIELLNKKSDAERELEKAIKEAESTGTTVASITPRAMSLVYNEDGTSINNADLQKELNDKYYDSIYSSKKMAAGGKISDQCPTGFNVQALSFDKTKFKKTAANTWLKENGFKNRLEITESEFRANQRHARSFKPTTLKTTDFEGKLPDGVKAVIGTLRSNVKIKK